MVIVLGCSTRGGKLSTWAQRENGPQGSSQLWDHVDSFVIIFFCLVYQRLNRFLVAPSIVPGIRPALLSHGR